MPRTKEVMVDVEKKGKPVWRPANKLKAHLTREQTKKYRPRWVDKSDEANLQKKQDEGWVFLNKETGLTASHDHRETEDGKNLTSVNEYRELVLMGLPKELAEARDEYYQERTHKQTVGLKEALEEENREASKGGRTAPIHGKIVIE